MNLFERNYGLITARTALRLSATACVFVSAALVTDALRRHAPWFDIVMMFGVSWVVWAMVEFIWNPRGLRRLPKEAQWLLVAALAVLAMLW